MSNFMCKNRTIARVVLVVVDNNNCPVLRNKKIIVDGQTRELVEICYAESSPLADEGPLLTEERNLIDRIAQKQNRTTAKWRM